MKRALAALTVFCLLLGASSAEQVKILAIGNSFTRNALKFFYPMAKSVGVNDLVVANMHISGCSLKKHSRHITKNLRTYDYFYQDASGETVSKKTRMSDVIAADDWDYVVLQQSGGHSGAPGLYKPYLSNVINYVKKNTTNPELKIIWHATWAFGRKCKIRCFSRYSYSQKRMYEAIVRAENSIIYPNTDIDKIIPVGRAVQAIRGTAMGDTLNLKDGYHLNDAGCYAAALTWVYTIFGVNPQNVTYLPTGVTPENAEIIRAQVAYAVDEYAR